MICKKKLPKLLLVSIISTLSIAEIHAFDQGWQDSSLKNYFKYAFCTSESCNNLSGQAKADFNEILDKAHRSRRSMENYWTWSASGCPSDEEIAFSAACDCIGQRAYDHARRLGASRTESGEIEKEIRFDLQKFRDDNRNKSLYWGRYNSFIGKGLERKVDDKLDCIRRSAKPRQVSNSQTPPEYRPSNKIDAENNQCCCCLDEHIPKAKQVYSPKVSSSLRTYSKDVLLYESCGHFMCINCTNRWYVTQDNNVCYQCNQPINKALLKKIIHSKNVRATQEALMSDYESQPGAYENPAPEGMSYRPHPRRSAPPKH